MAEKKLDKGSTEWQFFQDFWRLRQKYYDPDNEPDEWFDEVTKAASKIAEKYKNTEFSKFAGDLVYAHLSDLDRKHRERKDGEEKNE